jgi:hypothetical protein
MREGDLPAYLSTVTRNFCKRDGCRSPSLSLSWDCDTWSMPSESRVLLVSVAERADTLAVPRPYERIRTLGAV